MEKRMRKTISVISVYFLFCVNLLFSQEIQYGRTYYYPSEYGSIVINEDSYTRELSSGKEGIVTESYKSKITKNNNFTWLEDTEKVKEDYIILTCSIKDLHFLTLICSRKTSQNYFKNGEIYFYDDDDSKFTKMLWLRGFDVVKADSFLVEKLKDGTELKYLPEYTRISTMPWATKGDSDKKKIYLEPNSALIYNTIVIANGLICFDKPYLYEQNSRAKKIRVTWGKNSKDFELQDTPNFQPLVLSDEEKFYKGPVEIEILEVYKGSKYSDVVISGIYFIE